MSDYFSKSEVTDFLNFMKLPDGTPLVSDDMMDYLWNNGFFTAPASTKYHGNHEGGLLEHSDMVTRFLVVLTKDNLLSQFYTLTEEEIMCIRYHMGAFTDKSEWNDYTRAVRNYPNVLWTHQADMLASHVAGV